MTAGPFFSIVMATHLRPALLRRALQSLRDQRFRDFEVIVVADALDAESGSVAAQLLGTDDVFVKRRGEPGPAASRNRGLEMARGDWIVFLDDDDTFSPHFLQTLHAQARRPESTVLFTDCELVQEDRSKPGIPRVSSEKIDLVSRDVFSLWIKNFIPLHSLAYRRSAIDGCRFDPHLASLEDWDFLLAVCSRTMPVPYPGGGPVVHKDVNPGTRRGTREQATGSTVMLDCLHIYRRWPAPDPDLQQQRHDMLVESGMRVPLEWV